MKITVTLKDGTTGSVEIAEDEAIARGDIDRLLSAGAQATRDLGYFLTMGVTPQLWHLMGTRVPPEEHE